MNIDLVYLWCDGDDPAWKARRESYMPSLELVNQDQETFCEGRTVNNNELKYSLRSAEMYAPWINHIFIITDGQQPEWLDMSNPKVTIVDVTEIVDEKFLPLFNSTAIELNLANIKGLSEHFIYANDDMMFCRKVSPSFFFTPDGKSKSYFNITKRFRKEEAELSTYIYTIKKANDSIAKKFSIDCFNWTPSHQIDPYIKSNMVECLEKYKEWSESSMQNRFRSRNDLQRHIFSLYAIATGRGVAEFRPSYTTTQRRIQKIIIFLGIKKGLDSLFLPIHRKRFETKIRKFHPVLVCFNDSQTATNAHRLKLKALLEKLYPNKSSFEL